MADSDKDIRITPNTSKTAQPETKFVGKDNIAMYLKVLDDGSLSYESTQGQVFSISPTLSSGDIFSVNDISGLQSMAVHSDGTVKLAPFGGNVGIATTAPAALLDIHSTSGNQLRLSYNANYYWIFERDANGKLNITNHQNSTDVKAITIDTTEQVGIGTDAPVRPLHVVGDIYCQTGDILLSRGNYYLQDASDGTKRGSFPSAGVWAWENVDVGIGTTAPSTRLHVAESGTPQLTALTLDNGLDTNGGKSVGMDLRVRYASTNIASSYIGFDYYGTKLTSNSHGMIYRSGRAGFAHHHFVADDNTRQMMIADNGNVGIGSAFTHAAQPSYKLDVAGTLRATGTITGGADIAARWHTIGVTDGMMIPSGEPDGSTGILWESAYTASFGQRVPIGVDIANSTWTNFLVVNYGDNSSLAHTFPSVEVYWTLHGGVSSGSSTPSFMRSGRIRAITDASGNISFHTYGDLYIGGAQTSANLNKIRVRAAKATVGSNSYMVFQWQNNTGSTMESDATDMRINGNAHLMNAIQA